MMAGSIDLHMHTTVSDGTDTPAELLRRVRQTGLSLFSVTDHDAIKSAVILSELLKDGDPDFLSGVEFSCKDENGKYHILGYGYDPCASSIREVVQYGHSLRVKKVQKRLDFLKREFSFTFTEEELSHLMTLDNPGKPHIAGLMVAHGYADSIKTAIRDYIDRLHFSNEYVRPEDAIRGILGAGGIPVLAHPCYGSGDQLILGEEMDARIRRLTAFGLQGLEGFYSGFTEKLRAEILAFAAQYDLYVTAGSDYHGKNKLIALGDNGLGGTETYPEGLRRFLRDVKKIRMPDGVPDEKFN